MTSTCYVRVTVAYLLFITRVIHDQQPKAVNALTVDNDLPEFRL